MAISATLDHRAARITQVPVEPLLSQHGDECGEQGDQKACVHEVGDCDDLARWVFRSGWNGKGLAWNRRLIESEEDGTEEGRGLLVWVGPELRMDIDDEC